MDYGCSHNTTQILDYILKDVNATSNKTAAMVSEIKHFYEVVVFTEYIGQRILEALNTILSRKNLDKNTQTKAELLQRKISIELQVMALSHKGDLSGSLNPEQFSTQDMQATVETMEKIMNLQHGGGHAQDVLWDMVDMTFNVSRDIMKKSEDQHHTSTRMLRVISKSAAKLAESSKPVVSRKNFVAGAINVPDLPLSNLFISTKRGPHSTNNLGFTYANVSSVIHNRDYDVIFKIPRWLLADVFQDSKRRGRNVTLVSVVYNNDHLFSKWDDVKIEDKKDVNSQIISAEFVGQTIHNLTQPIEITFKLGKGAHGQVNKSCNYWQVAKQNWSSEGLTLTSDRNGDVTCLTNHLTNFAVMFNARPPSNINAQILNIITYIGLGISLASALLTFVTYLALPALRKNTPPKILMNLCLSLILMQIIFFVGVERGAKSKVACQAVGFLLQYSFLAIFAWNFVEGFHSMRGIAAPMKAEISRFLPKASLFAWGVPLIFTAVGFGIWPDDYAGKESCVVSKYSFYITVLSPIILVLTFNIIALFAIMKSLVTTPGKDSVNTLTFNERLRIAVVFMLLFGVTWIFGFFVVSNGNVVFQYLFCILSGLQGLYIMIAYCVRNKKVRLYWHALLCCKDVNHVRRMTSTKLRNKGTLTTDTTIGHSMSEAHHKVNAIKR